jgi:predicted transposase YbfD/YdcC
MELFGQMREEWLRTFLELPNGIPSHDTFGDVFSVIDPEALRKGFMEWVETVRQRISGEIVAIDGKTIRRSKDIQKSRNPLHVVSAWANENRLVLGEVATEEKSNEITAIPALLNLLHIKGCIVTIDAVGTQKEIAKAIISQEADYVLAVKENQKTLCDDIRLYFDSEVLTKKRKDLPEFEYVKTTEKSHGRYETRECFVCGEIDWLAGKKDWEGLSGIGLIVDKRQVIGREAEEIAYHYVIYSKTGMSAKELLHAKRSHWSIENSLHWSLDMVFREDESRIREGNGAENMNILRHLAINLIRAESSAKGSLKMKRKRCALSQDYLLKVIGVS